MDSFNLGNLKAEKANAIMKQRQLRKMANLFRFVEVCVVLVLISRISIRLPVAIKNSGNYFRDFSVFVVSPRFIFIIGNIIVITLFAQSGQFSSQSKSSEPDLYQKSTQNSTKNRRTDEEQRKYPKKQSIRTEDKENYKYPETEDPTRNQIINGQSMRSLKFEEEQIENPENQRTRTEDSMTKQRIEGGKIKCLEKQCVKTGDRKCLDYRRCKTEKFRSFQRDKPQSVLQRSETEKSRASYPEDGMSNDEFRRIVEAFIARQQRMRREEEYSVI